MGPSHVAVHPDAVPLAPHDDRTASLIDANLREELVTDFVVHPRRLPPARTPVKSIRPNRIAGLIPDRHGIPGRIHINLQTAHERGEMPHARRLPPTRLAVESSGPDARPPSNFRLTPHDDRTARIADRDIEAGASCGCNQRGGFPPCPPDETPRPCLAVVAPDRNRVATGIDSNARRGLHPRVVLYSGRNAPARPRIEAVGPDAPRRGRATVRLPPHRHRMAVGPDGEAHVPGFVRVLLDRPRRPPAFLRDESARPNAPRGPLPLRPHPDPSARGIDANLRVG